MSVIPEGLNWWVGARGETPPVPGQFEHVGEVPWLAAPDALLPASLSSSRTRTACAWHTGQDSLWVGIDVEDTADFMSADAAPAQFASVILGSSEKAWYSKLAGATGDERLAALLRTWVRKEAVVKALHTGFDVARGGVQPDVVEVSPPWELAACTWNPSVHLVDLTVSDPSDENRERPAALAALAWSPRR